MNYCPECGSEYLDGIPRCADCQVDLVSESEMRRRGVALPHEMDNRMFAQADTADDPLTATRFVSVLKDAKIGAFSRRRFGGTVDNLTGPSAAWWEILVPEGDVQKARALIEEERARIEAQAEDAGRAAEEEAESSIGKSS